MGLVDDGDAIMAMVRAVDSGATAPIDAARAVSSQSLLRIGVTRAQLSEALASVDLRIDEQNAAANTGVVIMGDIIKGNKIVDSTIHGSVVAADIVSSSLNRLEAADVSAETRRALESLHEAIGQLVKELPEEQAVQASKDLDLFTQEALSPRPRRKMLEVTGDGLIEAANFVAAIAPTVIAVVGAIIKAQ